MRLDMRHLGSAVALAATFAAAGCDSYFEVTNPNIVERDAVDPVQDADVFSRSAFQNFAVAYGATIVYSAWFTNEAQVGDSYPTRNEFGRRVLSTLNSSHRDDVWIPLARAVASTEEAVELLGEAPGADKSIHVARAALGAGFSVQLMAETFCVGTIRVGPKLDQNQMLDHAIERFEQARDVATAAGDTLMAHAARVGLARAYLQKGDKANAIAEAAKVPEDFAYNVAYVDNASSRARLGNGVYYYNDLREALVVGPEWRAMADAGDKRIAYEDGDRPAQDGKLHFFTQQKFPNWAAPIRLASGLEARYILAEAKEDMAEQIDLINERRAASGQGGVFASADSKEVLAELMEQRARDFWLEGKRMGDWRRNPESVPYILPEGNHYYKPELGPVGNQTCWVLPVRETDNNPHFK